MKDPQTLEEYRANFGLVKPSDLPPTQRRPSKKKDRSAKRSGIKLGKLLKKAGIK